MDATSAFVRCVKTDLLIGSDAKPIVDGLDKFHKFRSLVDPQDYSYFDRLVLHWHHSESAAPDAGTIFAKSLANGSRPAILSSRLVTRDDITGLVDCSDRDALFACYDLIGQDGSIEVVSSKQDRIDVHDGYRYDIESAIEIGPYVRSSAKVVLIDGFVESVSEIHHVLQRASESKVPMLMFARGFSPDVLNTLSVNAKRNTLDILPFAIKLDMDHVNDFYDLEVMTGSKVVSADKGQLISTVDFDALPAVTYVRYTPGEKKLVMRNDSTRDRAEAHLKKLRERLESTDTHNIQDIVGRIRRMTSLVCMVSMKDGPDYPSRKTSFKRASRLIDHYCRFGSIETSIGTFPKSSFDIALRHLDDVDRYRDETITLRF